MNNEETPRRHVDRAAQFVPFAALTGYYDLIRERAAQARGLTAGDGGVPSGQKPPLAKNAKKGVKKGTGTF